MKNILITGAARGLGKYLSDYFIKKGFSVFATTRDEEKINDSHKLRFFYLDLTKPNSIASLVKFFEIEKIKIDVLINNAGVAYLDPADVLDDNEHRHIFDVNFFGTIDLTKRIIALMRPANEGKLIFISSIVSVDCWPYLGSYAASKAAIESVAFEWAVLLKKWNISVSVVQPNPLPTDMTLNQSKNTDKSPYPKLIQNDLKWENINDVCEIILKIILDSSPKFRYQTGVYSKKAAQNFLKKDAHEKALKRYQKRFT
jgi:short-subunit dehydrogenase